MKIVCGSCGAKYSIADEKVQGKVFKIRCKKCSNVIVVKGNEDGDETVSATVGTAAEWYVVVHGEQVGPVTTMDIDSYFMSGRITAETFAWKDGLSDWVALSKLDEFGHLTQMAGAGPDEATQISDDFSLYQKQINEEVDETNVMQAASGLASSNDDGAFSSFDSPAIGNGGFSGGFSDFGSDSDDYGYAAAGASESEQSDGGGLFSSFDAPAGPQIQSAGNVGGMFASFDSDASSNDDFLGLSSSEPIAPSRSKSSVGASISAGSAGPAVGGDLVGKRNENSVLFSLSSLDQVQAVGSTSNNDAPAADGPVTEGSGLIDIRALASAHKTMKSTGGMGMDDGPSVDPFTTGTMSMPALMPMGSHRSNKPLIIGGVIGGVLLFGLIGAVGYLATRDNTPQVTEKIIIQEKLVQPEQPAVDAKAADEAAKAANSALEGEKPTEVAAVDTDKTTKDPKKSTSSSSKKTDTKVEAKEEPKEEPKKAEPKGDNIDRLLDQIDNGSQKEPKKTVAAKKESEPTSSSGGGKDKLDKSDVLNTIKAYSGRVNTCYKSQNSNNLKGTMKVKFAIKPNGGVTNVEVVDGTFAGTDVGRCVQKAVGGMKFPVTTAKDNVPVTYPFKLE